MNEDQKPRLPVTARVKLTLHTGERFFGPGICELLERIRKTGSCGGHNGIRNIIERLGTQGFVRIKLGVGKDKSNVVGHVLGKFDPETRTVMDRVVEAAAKAVASVISDGSDKAMNAYNGFDAKIPV